ncbi:hypothetical protein AAC387_Pa10g1317 [Persea americana]
MASNPTLLLALAWALFPLILFLFPISIKSRSTPLSNHPKRGPHHQLHQRPFEFTKKLKGCNKGDTIKDLHLLKRYLEKFGYIFNHSEGIDNDSFYDLLESAVKSYQYNFHLNPTLLLALAWALFPLILFLFPISIESRSTPLSNHPKRGPHHQLHQQPFEFTKKLEGCNKGDTIKDLHLLKRYLEKFGYIPNHSEGIDNDSFYDLLESAIKSYQYNFLISTSQANLTLLPQIR